MPRWPKVIDNYDDGSDAMIQGYDILVNTGSGTDWKDRVARDFMVRMNQRFPQSGVVEIRILDYFPDGKESQCEYTAVIAADNESCVKLLHRT